MELEGRGKIWNEDCWKLWRRVWVQGGIFTGPARLIEGLFTVEDSVDVLMATGGKVYTLGWFCLYQELSLQPWSGSWLLDLTEEVDVLGWPLCRVRVMVSWDVRWFVSGALYRKMVPPWLAAGVARLASPLEFQLQWHWARQRWSESVPTQERHWAEWWTCMSLSNQVTWNYRIPSCFLAQAMWFPNISLMKESVIYRCLCACSLFYLAFLSSSWLKKI